MNTDLLTFLQGFLQRPQEVASVVPSSRFVERKVVEATAPAEARLVVELGPGTGGITRALLRKMRPDSVLVAIELSPRFVDRLGEIEDERLLVHRGSAEELIPVLEERHLGAPDAVVSGIPFSTIDPQRARRIADAVWSSLAPGGRFVAYQVRDRVRDVVQPLGGSADVRLELLNLPPVRIFRWQKGA